MTGLTLKISEWPETDRSAWETARTSASMLDAAGLAAHWSDKNARQIVKDWGMYLTFQSSRALDEVAATGQRISRNRLEAYVEALRRRNLSPVTVKRAIRNLREFVRVTHPCADLGILTLARRRLAQRAQPIRNKRAKIIPSHELLAGGLRYIHRVERQKVPSEHIRASWARDGLIIAFLAMRPIRLHNLASMELGRHLLWAGDHFECVFEGEDVKNRLPLEFPVPAELTQSMWKYLKRHRVELLGDGQSHRLWLSVRRKSMTEHAIYCRAVALTKELFGKAISPHLFRDCLATTLAEEAPAEADIAARILGHATLRITESHYNRAQSLSAQRRYHKLISELRGSTESEGL